MQLFSIDCGNSTKTEHINWIIMAKNRKHTQIKISLLFQGYGLVLMFNRTGETMKQRKGIGGNKIDPMQIKAEWKDKLPKLN